MFKLHPTLAKDCFILGQFKLNLLLMMNDQNYPWFILVPMRDELTEIHQLDKIEQELFIEESSLLSHALQIEFSGDKMNIAALGNMVPQLHIHHVVRYKSDIAWPNPIWGFSEASPFEKESLIARIDQLKKALPKAFNWDDQWS